MKKIIIEIFGWYGMAAIVLGYTLVSFNVISVDNSVYQLLNLTGAIGIVVISLFKKAYPPALLNMIWMIVALIALLK